MPAPNPALPAIAPIIAPPPAPIIVPERARCWVVVYRRSRRAAEPPPFRPGSPASSRPPLAGDGRMRTGIGLRQIDEHPVDRRIVEPRRAGIGPGDELADLRARRRPRLGQAEQLASTMMGLVGLF